MIALLKYWKLAAGAGLLLLALAAGWKINGWRNDAARLDEVQAQIEQARHELAVAALKAAEEREHAAEFSRLVSDIRRERDLALDELDTRPTLTRTITKVVDDGTPCACDALGADFRVLWNGADQRDPDPAPAAAGSGDAAVHGAVPPP